MNRTPLSSYKWPWIFKIMAKILDKFSKIYCDFYFLKCYVHNLPFMDLFIYKINLQDQKNVLVFSVHTIQWINR